MKFTIGFIAALAVIIFLMYGFFSVLGSRKNIASIIVSYISDFSKLLRRKRR